MRYVNLIQTCIRCKIKLISLSCVNCGVRTPLVFAYCELYVELYNNRLRHEIISIVLSHSKMADNLMPDQTVYLII